MRARNSSEIEIENFPVLENGATEEYEQIETADDVQSEEVMEETILAGKERFDYVYKRIPEVEECITTEIEEIIENEVPESEILSNVSYLLQEDDKMNQNPLTKGDKCNQVFDQEAREENEEYVLDETVEYLEESCKEMSPPHKMPPEGHNETVSIEVRRQQQREAAERRRIEQESRGIKDMDKVRRQQQRAMEQERREQEANRMGGQPTLKWQQD
uniref:Uncharacterized protein n=1 Tax=Anopheles christyi TaxID=43041 RepID=A0A182JS07_9DIPT